MYIKIKTKNIELTNKLREYKGYEIINHLIHEYAPNHNSEGKFKAKELQPTVFEDLHMKLSFNNDSIIKIMDNEGNTLAFWCEGGLLIAPLELNHLYNVVVYDGVWVE